MPASLIAILLLTACGAGGPEDESAVAQPIKPDNSTTGSNTVYRPMTVQSEFFQKQWSSTDPSCFGTDDQYSFKVAGSLAPGESYTFHAIPTCAIAEMPAIVVKAAWDASELEVTSIAPEGDGISGDSAQAGTPIVAASYGREAHLCIFISPSGQKSEWAVTIRNKGTLTAYNVTLEGEEHNGWPVFFNNQCARADADGDGWNDSIEHGMGLLTYYSSYSNPSLKHAQLDGTNYLRAAPNTQTPDDEVDAYPPDVNDDGVVDQVDVDRVASFVGQGTGVGLDQIDANPGPNFLYAQVGPWRRYDLDGNGRVAAHDVELVRALVGMPIPMTQDILPPTIELRSPLSGATVQRASYQLLEAYGADNKWLTQVDFYVNDALVCSSTGGGLTYAQTSQHHCYWKTPRKQGTYTLTARTRDSAGNTATDSAAVIVK